MIFFYHNRHEAIIVVQYAGYWGIREGVTLSNPDRGSRRLHLECPDGLSPPPAVKMWSQYRLHIRWAAVHVPLLFAPIVNTPITEVVPFSRIVMPTSRIVTSIDTGSVPLLPSQFTPRTLRRRKITELHSLVHCLSTDYRIRVRIPQTWRFSRLF